MKTPKGLEDLPLLLDWKFMIVIILFVIGIGLLFYAIFKIPWLTETTIYLLQGLFDHCKTMPWCCDGGCL
jgi:hypothetical protein